MMDKRDIDRSITKDDDVEPELTDAVECSICWKPMERTDAYRRTQATSFLTVYFCKRHYPPV